MTREEAIRLLWVEKQLCHDGGHGEAKNFVDKLEALGLLEFSVPLTPHQRINVAINSMGLKRDAGDVIVALAKAGFKIVEA